MSVLKIKLNKSTTVNLTPFVGLVANTINWGDGSTVGTTLNHTYSSSGIYEIDSESFDSVTEIGNNFTVDGLVTLEFIGSFNNLSKIGDNFLKDCSDIFLLDMKELIINNIGDGFLKNTINLECLRVPYNYPPTLSSFGDNALKSNAKILCGNISDYYKLFTTWKDKSSIMYDTEKVYNDNVSIDNIKSKAFSKVYNIFIQNNKIDLNNYPTLKSKIDSGIIKSYEGLYNEIEPDPKTKEVKLNYTNIRKTLFILQMKYTFKKNPNDTSSETNIFYFNRLFKLIRTESDDVTGHILAVVEDYTNCTDFYLNKEEMENDTKLNSYYGLDMLSDKSESVLFEFQDSKIKDFNPDIDNEPYMRGYLVFSVIDEHNIRNIVYDGEEDTGFILEINAKGVCKNPIIYDNDLDEDLGRRPFIKIDTDRLDKGKILAGDKIIVTTKQGNKSAELIRESTSYNIIKCINKESTWLKLYKGNNEFFATADSGYYYVKTTDTAINPTKTYYTRSDTTPYVYTEVTNPKLSDINKYYERFMTEGSVFNLDIHIKYNDIYEGV